MNWKTVVPLAVALGLGTVAAKVGRDIMVKGRNGDGASAKVRRVVAAKEELTPGSTIKESELAVREMPVDGLPVDLAFANPADVVGRVVTTPVVKGQAVLETLLAPKGSMGGAQAMVPAGMRAITLEVTEVSGVGGLLTPGARVDVVQTLQGRVDDPVGMLAKTIVENLRVLAVGKRLYANAGGADAGGDLAKSVTLLATVAQAEAIDLASHMGTPRLVLRNGSDDKVTGGKGITVAELRGSAVGGDAGQKVGRTLEEVARMLLAQKPAAATRPADVAKAPPVERSNYREVEVIRGGTASSVRVGVTPAETAVTDGGGDQLEKVVPADR